MILRLVIPRELKSPNRINGRHWRTKHRETQEWEKWLWVTMLQQRAIVAAGDVVKMATAQANGQPIFRATEKRRVAVIRECPSKRNFIRDDDNLHACLKAPLDSLKRLGLIRDDSRKWLEQSITQTVSTDGRWRTVIEIHEDET